MNPLGQVPYWKLFLAVEATGSLALAASALEIVKENPSPSLHEAGRLFRLRRISVRPGKRSLKRPASSPVERLAAAAIFASPFPRMRAAGPSFPFSETSRRRTPGSWSKQRST